MAGKIRIASNNMKIGNCLLPFLFSFSPSLALFLLRLSTVQQWLCPDFIPLSSFSPSVGSPDLPAEAPFHCCLSPRNVRTLDRCVVRQQRALASFSLPSALVSSLLCSVHLLMPFFHSLCKTHPAMPACDRLLMAGRLHVSIHARLFTSLFMPILPVVI